MLQSKASQAATFLGFTTVKAACNSLECLDTSCMHEIVEYATASQGAVLVMKMLMSKSYVMNASFVQTDTHNTNGPACTGPPMDQPLEAVLLGKMRVTPEGQMAEAIEQLTYVPGSATGCPDNLLVLGGQMPEMPPALTILPLECLSSEGTYQVGYGPLLLAVEAVQATSPDFRTVLDQLVQGFSEECIWQSSFMLHACIILQEEHTVSVHCSCQPLGL